MNAEPARRTSTNLAPTVHSTTAPKGWVRETSIASAYAEVASDVRAMEREIERYGTRPADEFTRLDDFLAELDGD